MKGAEERFWVKVDTSGDCWEWIATRLPAGYGQFNINGKHIYAHRFSYEMHNGPIPDGMFVDHVCHNRSCVNPDHLRVVTPKQSAENKAGARSTNTSGVRGVSFDQRRGKWLAHVGHNRRAYNLGHFDSLEDAKEAARAKRIELFTHNDVDRSKS